MGMLLLLRACDCSVPEPLPVPQSGAAERAHAARDGQRRHAHAVMVSKSPQPPVAHRTAVSSRGGDERINTMAHHDRFLVLSLSPLHACSLAD